MQRLLFHVQACRHHFLPFARKQWTRLFTSSVSSCRSGWTEFCFDAANDHKLVKKTELQIDGRLSDAILSPSIQTTDETESLLRLLPDYIAPVLAAHEKKESLTEIILDVGRRPFAWIAGERHFFGDLTVSEEQIHQITGSLRFGSDNRAGIDGCLHRISALRNREDDIVGLTLRVGRLVQGNAIMIADLLYGTDSSILFVGPPGSGKTSIIRDVASLLAEKNSVIVVDTSCEIGGAGNVPHASIGLARRMQVKNINAQAALMIEAVQNHTPSCLVIDEIGRRSEVNAALTCTERGVRIIASAHGSLNGLVRNTELCDLVGGVEIVTIGDKMAEEQAENRGEDPVNPSKVRLQRRRPPVFDVVIELQSGNLHEWQVVFPCGSAVDSILSNGSYSAQIRSRDDYKESYIRLRNVSVSETEKGENMAIDATDEESGGGSCVNSADSNVSRKAMLQHALNEESCKVELPPGTLESFQSEFSGKQPQTSCLFCPKEFVHRRAMLTHVFSTNCKEKLKSEVLKTFQKELSRDDRSCPICAKTFVHRRAMLEHATKKESCKEKFTSKVLKSLQEEWLSYKQK